MENLTRKELIQIIQKNGYDDNLSDKFIRKRDGKLAQNLKKDVYISIIEEKQRQDSQNDKYNATSTSFTDSTQQEEERKQEIIVEDLPDRYQLWYNPHEIDNYFTPLDMVRFADEFYTLKNFVSSVTPIENKLKYWEQYPCLDQISSFLESIRRQIKHDYTSLSKRQLEVADKILTETGDATLVFLSQGNNFRLNNNFLNSIQDQYAAGRRLTLKQRATVQRILGK